ncbi:hypothetical protein [Sphingosinicella sp. CPCC 101087]|uniref:hypothetical protein n=1 Tax=Sphingosinicella sp. CPCC 101087 TaxID=2497754 RepID=UPI00101BAD42|nr:hypothetical protein [Sphingosinicella sp. CPCC 101087]
MGGQGGKSRRSTPAFGALVAQSKAETAELIGAAGATLAAFGAELESGTPLRAAQYAALRRLGSALERFEDLTDPAQRTDGPGSSHPPGGGETHPGSRLQTRSPELAPLTRSRPADAGPISSARLIGLEKETAHAVNDRGGGHWA